MYKEGKKFANEWEVTDILYNEMSVWFLYLCMDLFMDVYMYVYIQKFT